ncbi:hypothetical protein PENSPDRAFT_245147 [Peniophora sp. CONT]|nr:hypothetical protein PENSPDRAFT_245147 [Peniophora sp. CONT]
MADIPATTNAAPPPQPPPPVPIYLSSISHFVLNYMRFTSIRVGHSMWRKRTPAFLKAYPSAFDVQQPDLKVMPSPKDGSRMAVRYLERSYVTGRLIQRFKIPYSEMKRIHGPSKLRLDVTASSATTATEVDFSPVRTQPYMRTHPETGEVSLNRRTRKSDFELYRRPEQRADNRVKAIPPGHDAGLWASLIGIYNEPVVKSRYEKRLDRRGKICNGKVVSVDDEMLGWGEEWEWAEEEEDASGGLMFTDEPCGAKDWPASPLVGCEIQNMDASIARGSVCGKRTREDDDEERGAEMIGGPTVKKPRIVEGQT